MLKRLHLRNFTVFEDADFEFGPGLNVIVGANGTGKSHVLKVGYVTEFTFSDELPEEINGRAIAIEEIESILNTRVTSKLNAVFSADKLKNLIRYPHLISDDMPRAFVQATTGKDTHSIINFSVVSITNLSMLHQTQLPIIGDISKSPVFIPAKEVLTMGWLLPLYDRREIPIDETYPDLLRLLMGPPLRQPEPAHIVAQLQQLIGGKVEEEGGHFYLAEQEQPRMEMNLVAEGVRKFATLYKLLANGTLTPETTLFWDEPEANLNPALLKEMAAVLTELAKAGFQIILATHSLFLLKELHILSRREKQSLKYFGLSAENGGPTQIATADNLTDLPNIVALDAEMAQSDAFLDVLNHDDAGV